MNRRCLSLSLRERVGVREAVRSRLHSFAARLALVFQMAVLVAFPSPRPSPGGRGRRTSYS